MKSSFQDCWFDQLFVRSVKTAWGLSLATVGSEVAAVDQKLFYEEVEAFQVIVQETHLG